MSRLVIHGRMQLYQLNATVVPIECDSCTKRSYSGHKTANGSTFLAPWTRFYSECEQKQLLGAKSFNYLDADADLLHVRFITCKIVADDKTKGEFWRILKQNQEKQCLQQSRYALEATKTA